MKQAIAEKYAAMLVRVGLNLQAGQTLVLQASMEASQLAQAVTEAAFKAGAKDVIVHYDDPEITRLRAKYCDVDTLRKVEDWQKESLDLYLRDNGVQLGLNGTYPDLFEGIPDEKSIAVNAAKNELRNVVRHYIHKGVLQWTGTAVPNMQWAKKVHPDLSPEEAFIKLQTQIMEMVRVSEDNDPIQDWQDHCARLGKVSAWLNEQRFDSLHITSELGTDIKMDLVKNHIWTSAADMGESDTVPYVANIPTEEIFTDPNKWQVNGKAVASRPLILNGKLVTDFSITFKEGRAVDCDASANVDLLKAQLFKDEYSCYLGEVALVSKQSPITKMNTVFFNGLIDENAASHLAFGASFPSNVKGGTKMSPEELDKNGINSAANHNDFMIGTPDFKVVGFKADGTEVTIMEHGDFVIGQ